MKNYATLISFSTSKFIIYYGHFKSNNDERTKSGAAALAPVLAL